MARYALIRDGIVDNVVLWDGNLKTWQPPDGYTARQVGDRVQPGDTWDGTNYTTAPRPVAAVNRETLEGRAAQALDVNRAYLAKANPSVTDNTNQIKALTRQTSALIRLLLGALDQTD